MSIRDNIFWTGILTTTIVSFVAAASGPPWAPTACLYVFWGYLLVADIIITRREMRKSKEGR